MKKNGFTLIEVLTVIIILSMISLITVPLINNLLINSKKKALESSAYGLVESARIYYGANLRKIKQESIEFNSNNNYEGLKIKGDIPNGKIVLYKNGKTELAIYNEKYCITKSKNTVKLKTELIKNVSSCEIK